MSASMTTWTAIAALVNDADVEGCLRGRFDRDEAGASAASALLTFVAQLGYEIHPRQWHDPRPTGAHPPYSPDAAPDPLDRLVVLRPVSGDRRRAAVLAHPRVPSGHGIDLGISPCFPWLRAELHACTCLTCRIQRSRNA